MLKWLIIGDVLFDWKCSHETGENSGTAMTTVNCPRHGVVVIRVERLLIDDQCLEHVSISVVMILSV
jgi:hypothetical protein